MAPRASTGPEAGEGAGSATVDGGEEAGDSGEGAEEHGGGAGGASSRRVAAARAPTYNRVMEHDASHDPTAPPASAGGDDGAARTDGAVRTDADPGSEAGPNGSAAPPLDVLIAGAGYVGLSLAVALKRGAPHLHVRIVDAAPEGVWRRDGRASAIASAASAMLARLGVWDRLLPHAQPIEEMIVTDSRVSDPVRPVFLTFGTIDAGPDHPGPFAHMVPNIELNGALREEAARLGVRVEQGVRVEGIGPPGEHDGGAAVVAELSTGERVPARLLAAADGVRSAIRRMAGIRTVSWSYGQSGIVCTVRHERPHGGRAEEHFLPAGPFATLPLKPVTEGDATMHRSSLVWTESTGDAERLLADDFLFEVELEQRFGRRLGRIEVEGTPRAFPLGLTLARDFVRPRLALVGDAAHGIHPIAGQGLNLGFKDVAALAETVVDASRTGRDIGAIDVLERYERWRRADTVLMGATTDALNRLFSNDSRLLRAARTFGLGLVDRLPPAKRFFIDQAAGRIGPQPRLLRGEAL